MEIQEKLNSTGLQWPDESPAPMANYVTVRRTGNLLFVSGAGPFVNGKPVYQGRVGAEVTLEEAREASRITVVNLLSMVSSEVADLHKIKIIKLLAFVNSAPDFYDQPKVIDAASDLFAELLGEKGKHARSAIGTSVLPFNIPVEIEMVAEIED
ncbi:RidA family protein [Evansella sp. LMS18]|jgi:enamine deaminase RidA (YjgF/YER057c/UK114 family)|uniref:RidA family protein n=1 Tax=Evansella sp. LMS18 TaxID=2924033 RepID=UPI0020D1EDFA|nr:RidA family protein [Evansella sp. LMS18]UTR10430.1 RidA family protein [Evansella sp. LMS18]